MLFLLLLIGYWSTAGTLNKTHSHFQSCSCSVTVHALEWNTLNLSACVLSVFLYDTTAKNLGVLLDQNLGIHALFIH